MCKKITYFVCSAVIITVIFQSQCDSAFTIENSNEPNLVINDANCSDESSKPIIIWWARVWDDPETLRLAISSGIFSHVMLVNVHKFAGLDHLYEKNIKKALELCKQKDVEVIWLRWLYPGTKLNGFEFEDAFKAEYYITQIRNIKAEANQRGINLIAFDAEPYANKPLKGIIKRRLSNKEMDALNKAINTTITVTGKVDFILPAGGEFKKHIWNCTHRLGKLTISEHTYYDIPSTHTKRMEQRRPYDIMGAYVNVTKENKYKPRLSLFTPREILSRQNLWAHKKGLFVYPGSKENTALIAREFAKIKTIYPIKDSNSVKE